MKKFFLLSITFFFSLILFSFQKVNAQSGCPTVPTGASTATITTNIAETGTYTLWSRINPPDTTNNAFMMQVGSECPIIVGDSSTIPANTWTWVNYKDGNPASKISLPLTPGSHILKVYGTESKLKIDRLLLTSDPNCTPTGTGDNCAVAPTSTPTRTPTPIPQTPTVIPTNTPFPTQAPNPADTKAAFTLLLHGVGKGGDSQNPDAPGNTTLISPQRPVTIDILDQNKSLVKTVQGTITFQPTAGNLTGTIGLGSPLPNGSYFIRLKTPRYLRALLPGFITVDGTNNTSIITLPVATLVVGDSNDDSAIDVLDYNIINDCFSIDKPPRACDDPNKRQSADLNDDGKVDGTDINLLIRNSQVRSGQ